MDYRVGEQFAVVFEFEVVLDLTIHHRDRPFVGTKQIFIGFHLDINLQYRRHCPCQRISPFSVRQLID